jgi:hypothetical protein
MEHVLHWSPKPVLNTQKGVENDKLSEQLQPYLMQLQVLYLWFTSHHCHKLTLYSNIRNYILKKQDFYMN